MTDAAREITVHVGDVVASAAPATISTLLGSCVAVCLWDPGLPAGGMNHFLLPAGDGGPTPADQATRFGVHAMDRLIGEMLKLGADPGRCIAKVFGGASVLALSGSAAGIPQANVDFVMAYLAREHLPVAASSVGGTVPRHIRFRTDTGTVTVRRVIGPREQALLAETEQRARRRRALAGDVTGS